MNRRKAIKKLMPFLTVIAVVAVSGMLVFAVYFDALNLQWVTFLSGVLAASLLAMVVRATRAEFFAARRLARLSVLQERLGREQKRRDELERALAAANAKLHFADEALPLMVGYVDVNARYQYQNRALQEWLGLRKDKIDGQHMREVHGRKVFREFEAAVARAIEGHAVEFEWTQKLPDASVCRLFTQFLPCFDDKRACTGFYALFADVTERADVQATPEAGGLHAGGQLLRAVEVADATPRAAAEAGVTEGVAKPGVQKAAASGRAADRILGAIKRGEFSLFCQPIRPLQNTVGLPEHYEIFIRLLEEESNLIPPGAFFPLAEEHGLLPQLDRWVIEHLLAWVSSRKEAMAAGGRAFFINIALDTMCDTDFPEFCEYQLRKNALSGNLLCFEIPETAFNSRPADVDRFASLVKETGCRLALSGFGRDGMSVDLLKRCPLDFVKIHGSAILGLERDAPDLGKLLAITRITKVIGISTVAEMVETAGTIARLREAGVDFAQGFGISKPQPLAALVSR